MIFAEKAICLKDGRTAILKSPSLEDAQMLLDYAKQTSAETDFLTRYPEEWTSTVEQESAWIDYQRTSPNALTISCYIDGHIAGNCTIEFCKGIKTAHRANIGIALLKPYWNLGIGSAMFDEMIAAAQTKGTEILELAFLQGNDRARCLYEKFGFRVVCEKPNAFKLKDGTYKSEFYMQKYLKG